MTHREGRGDAPRGDGDHALKSYLAHLARAGARPRVATELRRDADQPGRPHAEAVPELVHELPGLPPIVERRRGRVASDHATWSVADALVRDDLVPRGGTVWEIGAGTGLLTLVAHHRGAARLLATDVDEQALDVLRENAAAAGACVAVHAGSLLDAVPASESPPDLLLANLPHKPSREQDELPLAEDGGPDGDRLLLPFWEQAAARLARGARLVFFQHSLPHPRNLAALGAGFDVTLLSWKRRLLADGEYGALADWFAERAAAGSSYVGTTHDGRRFLVACVFSAVRR